MEKEGVLYVCNSCNELFYAWEGENCHFCAENYGEFTDEPRFWCNGLGFVCPGCGFSCVLDKVA